MNIKKVANKIRQIKQMRESAPTNSVGANGLTNNASASGPLAGFDRLMFPPSEDLLSQDYQTPGQSGLAKWRFSNVYPVQKVTEKDVDDMVDASKEYINKVDGANNSNRDNMKSSLNNIINMIRSLKEDKIINDGKKLVNPKKNPLIKKEEMSVGAVPTNNASSGNIAGLPPDQPPVKKKKKYIYGGHGSRKMWLANKK
tara:strand:- start:110 stop:706 length:597 start_codon:yes stop_codon:yes gene_type:complete